MGQGLHTSIVELGLRWGIALFIVSEIFFFVRFFELFFIEVYPPMLKLDLYGPPSGSLYLILFKFPSLIVGNYSQTKRGLIITVLLGVYFTCLQALEYYEARFRFADRVYGSTFFIATGFHGLHVLVGTLFLIVSLGRHIKYEFSASHHFGFEA